MLSKLLRATVQKVTLPVGRWLLRAGVTSDAVTILGAVVVLVACWFITTGEHRTAGIILTAGGLFDALDGAVARASGRSTVRGAFLDSSVDRISDAAMLIACAWYYLDNPLGAGLAMAGLALGFLTSYIRARAEGLGLTCTVGIAERTERIILVAAGLIFGVLIYSLAVLVLLGAVTVVQRFVHVWKQASALR